MIKLKPRLMEIANLLLPPNAEKLPLAVCDIGTDHGYIPIYLVQNGVKKVIATDISKDSAYKALQNIRSFQLEDQIQVRVGNGLNVLSDNEADTVIIAGMGGLLIREILSQGVPKGVQKIILQPMRSVYELRKYLAENDFQIIDETLVYEGKRLYNIVSVRKGTEENNNEFDYFFGAKLIEKNHPLLIDYAKKEHRRILKRIKGLAGSGREIDKTLIEHEKRLAKILRSGGVDIGYGK